MWTFDLSNLSELNPVRERILDKKNVLDSARPLPTSALRKIQEALKIEWSYHSNGIEGNTLTLQETHLIVNEGLTIKGHPMREHLETINHDIAITKLYELVDGRSTLHAHEILDLHRLVLRTLDDDYAGRIRNMGVKIGGANFIPPKAALVSDLFDDLITLINDNPYHFGELELATVFHHKFVWVHPFTDGNGRTARLATNLYLMNRGYPPMILLKEDRKKYYTALNDANKGNYLKLARLIYQAIERTLNIYLATIPDGGYDVYEPIANIMEEPLAPYLSPKSTKSYKGYKADYISLLARQGKIDAYKEGNTWWTSKQAIEDYLVNRKRTRVRKD